MTIEEILQLYETIKNRLPKTYPKPRLILHEDSKNMAIHNKVKLAEDESVLMAVFNGKDTISLPIKFIKKADTDDETEKEEEYLITKITANEIALILLHELAHARALKIYGHDKKKYEKYDSEQAADRFAYRWLKKLKKEKIL